MGKFTLLLFVSTFGANVPSPAATNFDGSVNRQKRKTSEDHDQGKRMRF